MKSKHPLGLFCSESTNGFSAFVAIHIREQWLTPAVAQEKGNQTASFDMNTNTTRQAEDANQSPHYHHKQAAENISILCYSVRLQEESTIRWVRHNIVPQSKSKMFLYSYRQKGWGGWLGLQLLWRNNPILLTNSSTFWRHDSVHVLLGYYASGKRGFTPKAKHRNGRDTVSQASYVLQLLNEITSQSKNQLLPE